MQPKLLAAITNPAIPAIIGSGNTTAGGTIIGKIVGAVIGGILLAGFLLSFFYIVTGGISWITSGGDKNQLENARNKITNAVIGLIVVAAVWAIMTLVGKFIGIDFPKIPIPTIAGT
jgi:hypothetical protein